MVALPGAVVGVCSVPWKCKVALVLQVLFPGENMHSGWGCRRSTGTLISAKQMCFINLGTRKLGELLLQQQNKDVKSGTQAVHELYLLSNMSHQTTKDAGEVYPLSQC